MPRKYTVTSFQVRNPRDILECWLETIGTRLRLTSYPKETKHEDRTQEPTAKKTSGSWAEAVVTL